MTNGIPSRMRGADRLTRSDRKALAGHRQALDKKYQQSEEMVGYLQDRVTTLEAQVQSLVNRVTALEKKGNASG